MIVGHLDALAQYRSTRQRLGARAKDGVRCETIASGQSEVSRVRMDKRQGLIYFVALDWVAQEPGLTKPLPRKFPELRPHPDPEVGRARCSWLTPWHVMRFLPQHSN